MLNSRHVSLLLGTFLAPCIAVAESSLIQVGNQQLQIAFTAGGYISFSKSSGEWLWKR